MISTRAEADAVLSRIKYAYLNLRLPNYFMTTSGPLFTYPLFQSMLREWLKEAKATTIVDLGDSEELDSCLHEFVVNSDITLEAMLNQYIKLRRSSISC